MCVCVCVSTKKKTTTTTTKKNSLIHNGTTLYSLNKNIFINLFGSFDDMSTPYVLSNAKILINF